MTVGVTVGLTVGVMVGARVGLAVGVTVGVGTAVEVAAGVGTVAEVAVGVGVGTTTGVAVDVGATVAVAVGVGAFVGDVARGDADQGFRKRRATNSEARTVSRAFQRNPPNVVERTVVENPFMASKADRHAFAKSCRPVGPSVTDGFMVLYVFGLAEARPATSTTVTRPTAMSNPSILIRCTASFPRRSPRPPHIGAGRGLPPPHARARRTSVSKGEGGRICRGAGRARRWSIRRHPTRFFRAMQPNDLQVN